MLYKSNLRKCIDFCDQVNKINYIVCIEILYYYYSHNISVEIESNNKLYTKLKLARD